MLTQAQSLIALLVPKLTAFHAQILSVLNAEMDSLLITKLAQLARPIVELVQVLPTVLNASEDISSTELIVLLVELDVLNALQLPPVLLVLGTM